MCFINGVSGGAEMSDPEVMKVLAEIFGVNN
jgi:hypothetical protein